jgi:hypothetical protein
VIDPRATTESDADEATVPDSILPESPGNEDTAADPDAMTTPSVRESTSSVPAIESDPGATGSWGRSTTLEATDAGISESQEPSTAVPTSPTRRPVASGAVRDRIVILGRRNAGKTIFLARVYEQLWRSTDNFHMRALDGNDHLFFMETARVLSERVWPPATGSSTQVHLEVTLEGRTRKVTSLDYSGEVFKRAFIDGSVDPGTIELLANLDRAAAVILLVDPGIVLHGTPEQIAEDEFGLTAAVRRVRQGTGGGSIPIALVLTKLDLHGRVVRECGGLVGFVKNHLFPLLRALHRVRVFGCVAVRSRPDAMGRPRPDPATPPMGLLEPLEYCMKAMPETPAAAQVSTARAAAPSTETADDAGAFARLALPLGIVAAAGIAAGFIIAWALGMVGGT